jgi:hypothetical protein
MLLIMFIAAPQTAFSQSGTYSASFQSLLSQIQTMYCHPNGFDFNTIRSTYPVTFATILGHALRQQLLQTQRDPGLKPAFDQLQQEAKRYFSDSFRQYQYRFDNGQPMQEQALWQFVQDGINGLNDNTVLRDYGVVQGSMPSVAASSSTPLGPVEPESSVPINKPKEKNAIILLGVEAPEVKSEPAPSLNPASPAPESSNSSFETTTPMTPSTGNDFELNK